MYSIIIPTFNNLSYLKFCISSIKKNSKFKHEIIPHINEGTDGTEEFLITNKIDKFPNIMKFLFFFKVKNECKDKQIKNLYKFSLFLQNY